MLGFLVLLWVKVIDAPSMAVQPEMTDGLKTSMSSSLTSTILMEAASYDFEMSKHRSLRDPDEVVELAKLYRKCKHQDLLKSF